MPKQTTLTKRTYGGTKKKKEKAYISFAQFYAVYATLEQFDHIPEIHFEIIRFLEALNEWENNTAVLQAFRNAAKSSIVASFIVWLLVNDPSLLIVVLSADDATAQKTISDCQKIINIHPMASHLKDDENVWTARGFRVVGATSGRNLSCSARGIFSNVTGHRADMVICDDVEVPKNAATEELRDKLRARISESFHLLNPNGKRLFVGTPHSWDSIYPETIDKGASSLRIPLLNDIRGEFPNFTGISAWPERWTEKEVKAKQLACKTKAEFLSQYQLIPVNVDETTLDPSLIIIYKDEIRYVEANRTRSIFLGDKEMSGVAAFWDPALSSNTGDNSVLSIVFCDRPGNIYLHRCIQLSGDADQQCMRVRDIAIQFHLPMVTIETNGVGAFLPQVLLKYVRGLGIGVDGQHTKEKKTDSIRFAFETPLSAKLVHASEQVINTKFIQQMKDFNPRFPRGKDDFIDSSAKAIHKLPIRIGRDQTNKVEGFRPVGYSGQQYEIPRDNALA